MNASILSSFFFLQMVENYKVRRKLFDKAVSRDISKNRKKIMDLFSVVYTVMETQANGLPITEEDLEISAAMVSSFSWHYCLGISDPYIITKIMWEAYREGNLTVDTRHYKKLHTLAKGILSNLRQKAKHNV